MLGWAAAYVVLVAAAFVVVLARREPTVVRGDRIFLLTALYVLMAAGVTTVRGGRLSLGVLVVSVVGLAASWLLRSRWWVVGAEPDVVATTIEECASRLCAPSERGTGECRVMVPGGALHLRVVPAGRSTMIVFVADAKHRKAHLFRRLLAKQYRAVTPTIRLGPSPRPG
ncbi:MAG TPA: hypothetical protein VL308_12435 [Gemmatimonadaceae bacterium]|nr:hypothetical protein [Gemmatimonadaceae bacterium]